MTNTHRHDNSSRAAKGWWLGLVLGLLMQLWPMWTEAGVIEPGHSAAWYDPTRDGEGWLLEIRDDDRALMTWYTYDETGGQRWLIGEGHVVRDDDGESIVFPDLYVTRGGRFGPGFDASLVEREVVGWARWVFDDCAQGRIQYGAFGQEGELEVYRLTHAMAAGCRPIHGVTGEPVYSHAGHSGTWFQRDHEGEGWLLQWMSSNRALITWYTYDDQGNQVWLIGEGEKEGGRVVFPEVYSTHGGRFGGDFDSADVERVAWGRLELGLDCDSGWLWYQSSNPVFGTGQFDTLERLTSLAGLGCPWQAPAFNDLYDMSLTRLPTEGSGPLNRGRLVRDLADDGTVIASVVGVGVERLQPDDGQWQLVANLNRVRTNVLLSPDARTMVGGNANPEVSPFSPPVRWHVATGVWQPLPGFLGFERTAFTGVSPDHGHIVGWSTLGEEGGQTPWIWNVENGPRLLRLSEGLDVGAYPGSASDDGRIVFGTTIHDPYGVGFARPGAVRWVDDLPPEPLLDNSGFQLGWASATDSVGRVVFGYGQMLLDDSHPNAREAWYWIEPGHMAYLGTFQGIPQNSYGMPSFSILDVTHDGSLAVGVYSPDINTAKAILWTQDTGMVLLSDVLDEVGLLGELEEDTGPWTEREAIKVSSSGDQVLIRGSTRSGGWQNHHAAILHLTPKR